MKRLVLIWLGLCCHAAGDAPARPNILVILTDDLGYGDVSIDQERDVRTPNLERLASSGMHFTGMRANATVCSPSRAALLTGCYADRVGVPGVIRTNPENSWGFFDPRAPTLADELKRAGYHTALIGKWHLGQDSPNHPNDRGFDLFHGFLGDMMDSYTTHLRGGVNYMRHNREVIDPKGHATDLFAEWTCAHLRQMAMEANRPFFLYLAFNAPHFPIEPPDEWLAKVKARSPEMDRKRAANVAFVEHLDDRIGRVLETLGQTGLDKNTLVVFSSDNGGATDYAQDNGPWRGGKQSHYDGGLRVPFIMRWPGRIEGGSRSDYQGLLFDVFPTALEAAGVKPLSHLDARSLIPVIEGRTSDEMRDLYFVRREGGAPYFGASYEALIRGDWKLLRNHPFEPYELYNLRRDPQESNELSKDHPGLVKEMSKALSRHIQRGGAVPWQTPAVPAMDSLR